MKHRLIVLVTLAIACNTAPEKKQEDSTIVDATKTLVPVAPPPPVAASPYEAEIAAQDSLFDDGSIPASWANAGFDDPAGFKRFLVTFKEWVRTGNVDSITAHIRFPLKNYKTPAIFREKYDKIFDASLKAVVDTQRLDRIFRNAQGAMIGNGDIWFSVFPEGYRIIAINK
ncbi:hypothetical protein EGT74_03390 [Chitinophaga lutea]|uniref:Uncharacterized protein n=1 Tax=Chitinophaga lutea TaxID=2488634 RepID=A0A3N4PXG8_9BACT|nr:hypothetical protein [Chitinophaga lutea]RPE12606.1 hypothetical protein EGT74_03390 [Chitinophaga lutea]